VTHSEISYFVAVKRSPSSSSRTPQYNLYQDKWLRFTILFPYSYISLNTIRSTDCEDEAKRRRGPYNDVTSLSSFLYTPLAIELDSSCSYTTRLIFDERGFVDDSLSACSILLTIHKDEMFIYT